MIIFPFDPAQPNEAVRNGAYEWCTFSLICRIFSLLTAPNLPARFSQLFGEKPRQHRYFSEFLHLKVG